MTKNEILLKLKEPKPIYEKDGFIIKGLFGSYARDEATENSDIDILYDIEASKFCTLYPSFQSFSRLSGLKTVFSKNIDLATIDNKGNTFQKFALKDAAYV